MRIRGFFERNIFKNNVCTDHLGGPGPEMKEKLLVANPEDCSTKGPGGVDGKPTGRVCGWMVRQLGPATDGP
jgi:hypothetical protein